MGESIKVGVEADTAAFDEWIAQLRLLVSQVGFALDAYLASRPSRPAFGPKPCVGCGGVVLDDFTVLPSGEVAHHDCYDAYVAGLEP